MNKSSEAPTTPQDKIKETCKTWCLRLADNPDLLIVLFAAYFFLQIGLRVLTPPALRIDEAQQVLFAQWLALGYDTQPPLYNWYQQLLFKAFGTSIATIALAKNIILFLTFAIYIKTAALVLENKRFIAVSALALFVIPQVFWQAQRDLTHTTMLMLTLTALLYCSIRLIQRPTLTGYVLIGVVAGLGTLSKYNFAIGIPSLLLAVLFHPRGRERIFDRRFLLTVVVSILVALPHLSWLIDNFGLASEVTLHRMAEDAPDSRILQIVRGMGHFISGSAIIFAVPALLLSLAASGENKLALTTDNVWIRFFFNYFVAFTALMTIVVLTTTMTDLRDRWLLPLILPAPILGALYAESRLDDAERFVTRFLPIPLFMMALVPIALLISHPLTALLGKAPNSIYDWQAFQRHIVETEDISPSVIVTTNWHTGGNLRFLFPDVPVATTIYDGYDPHFRVTDAHPALLVWRVGQNDVSGLSEWLERQLGGKLAGIQISTLELPMYYPVKDHVLRISYAVIRPGNIE